MKTNIHLSLAFLFSITLLVSCEKEIAINLNKTNPRYVIEANISNVLNKSEVMITRTLNFDETNIYPTVSNAMVTITDTTLQFTDTLGEKKPGIYSKFGLYGIEGHTYQLKVKIGSEVFTSLSTLPYPLHLDTLQQLNLAGQVGAGGPPAGTPGAGKMIQILPIYKNTTGTDKYFQFVITKNDSLQSSIIARSDLASNPTNFPFPLFVSAQKNDTLVIDMQFIDKNVYDYFYGLNRNLGQFSATPSNPASNISNGALGFFKAHSSQRIKMVIK
jgi:hypothetical protein